MKERPILFSAPMVKALLADTKTQTRRLAKFKAIEPGFNLRFSGVSTGHYCTGVPSSGHVLYSRRAGGVWEQRTKPLHCPFGEPGDRLWVRETWRTEERESDGFDGVRFRADDAFQVIENTPDASERWLVEHRKPSAKGGKWRPSIYTPRWASRIDLEVTGVRVERLQAISEADAIAEGIERVRGRDVPAAMGGGVETWRDYLDAEGLVTNPVSSYRTLWESINGPGSWAENPWVWVVEFKRRAP